MIKDNYIDVCGSIIVVMQQVVDYQKEKGLLLLVMIEVCNLVELYEVMEIGVGKVDWIMFDNFELFILVEVVVVINKCFEIEVFGGVNIYIVCKIVQMGVNFIFVGVLIYFVISFDLSLKVVK